ncbi:relaxase/mobilization nuclease domain-containing protein [Pseudonocardia broussonetiae]|uniref:Mobilization protein n=1 Tax=Pseudonocardia broussonetiae TaxID=2736640 RepID=A0A6M6JK84_9PSEU|nr:mobilization protein [Pseudonocardia broussonetiae]QJY47776.1 mobilization protein [Pseudonocardia broussonetiae]
MKVVHGWRVGGLVTYLMGPGRAQEHVRPRVIASWDGRDAAWQPAQTGVGEFDLELGPMIRALRAPAIAAGLGESDDQGRRGYVWHCSARVAGGDRVLSDAEWAQVARELLDGSGVAPRGDAGGPRWLAIRHADDHVHIAVVLVRQDTCRRFWPSHDYPRLRTTAQQIERRLGLVVTATADGTAARAPGRGEIEKARRQGREPARVELAWAVRAASVTAAGLPGFIAALDAAGYRVEVRRAPSGDPLGYKVARPGDLTVAGEPVFYSGSKLAPDLSLPRLTQAWESAARGSGASVSPSGARRRVQAARAAVGSSRRGEAGEDADGIVQATGAVVTALREWSGELGSAADVFDRAARIPRGVRVQEGNLAAGLRRTARHLLRQRRGLGAVDEPGAASLALALAVSSLVREIAAWHQDRGRAHQAAAARASATLIAGWVGERTVDGLRPPAALDRPVTTRGPRPDHAAPGRRAGANANRPASGL